jgi:hypothetical protein
VHHFKARAFFRSHAGDIWVTSPWAQFETANALRNLCLAPRGPEPQTIEAIIRLFKHWHRKGPFQLEKIVWEEVISELGQISAAHATVIRTRAADTLHIAILEQINPDLFVTGDKDQHALAVGRGFTAVRF